MCVPTLRAESVVRGRAAAQGNGRTVIDCRPPRTAPCRRCRRCPSRGVTVAVKVTVWPYRRRVGEALTAVVVLAWDNALAAGRVPLLVLKLVSPL